MGLTDEMNSVAQYKLDELLRKAKEKGRYTVASLARDAGIAASKLSAFRNGIQGLYTSNFIEIVRALPLEDRIEYCNTVFDLRLVNTPIAKLAKDYITVQGITKDDFENTLVQRTPLSHVEAEDIISGRRNPTDEELAYLGMLLCKPDGKPYLFHELVQIRDQEGMIHDDTNTGKSEFKGKHVDEDVLHLINRKLAEIGEAEFLKRSELTAKELKAILNNLANKRGFSIKECLMLADALEMSAEALAEIAFKDQKPNGSLNGVH